MHLLLFVEKDSAISAINNVKRTLVLFARLILLPVEYNPISKTRTIDEDSVIYIFSLKILFKIRYEIVAKSVHNIVAFISILKRK